MDSLVLLHFVITRFQNFQPEEAITCFVNVWRSQADLRSIILRWTGYA